MVAVDAGANSNFVNQNDEFARFGHIGSSTMFGLIFWKQHTRQIFQMSATYIQKNDSLVIHGFLRNSGKIGNKLREILNLGKFPGNSWKRYLKKLNEMLKSCIFRRNLEFHPDDCQDLEKRCNMSLWSLRSVLIQLRSSCLKSNFWWFCRCWRAREKSM